MESLIVDQTRIRRVGDSSAAGGGGGGGGGTSAMRPRHKSVNSLSLSQFLLPNHQYFAPTSHYYLQQQQMMSYWSSPPQWPPFSISDQIKLASPSQPPLLPLPPIPKATRSREKQAKPVSQRKGSGSRQCGREPNDQVQLQKQEVQKAADALTEEEESSIYSLSPPPGNLPLPSFVLTRQI